MQGRLDVDNEEQAKVSRANWVRCTLSGCAHTLKELEEVLGMAENEVSEALEQLHAWKISVSEKDGMFYISEGLA
jgi:biotin operon repressor